MTQFKGLQGGFKASGGFGMLFEAKAVQLPKIVTQNFKSSSVENQKLWLIKATNKKDQPLFIGMNMDGTFRISGSKDMKVCIEDIEPEDLKTYGENYVLVPKYNNDHVLLRYLASIASKISAKELGVEFNPDSGDTMYSISSSQAMQDGRWVKILIRYDKLKWSCTAWSKMNNSETKYYSEVLKGAVLTESEWNILLKKCISSFR